MLFNKSKGFWAVLRFEENDNRVLTRPDEVSFLRSHRKIRPDQKAEIMSLAASGIRKFHIMETFITISENYNT
jgi:zinc finger SWIM domain-containing protein 3